MQKLVEVFSALDPMRRILVIGATVGVFAAILFLARMGGSTPTTLLYSGLDPASAGEVIETLDQMGEPYEVRGSAIYVSGARRDSLRMALAAEGKPASGTSGYEILDNLSGFSTTSQMFDAAYLRAKEGELARTIMSNPQIRSARVHISTPPGRGFGNRAPTSASVAISAGGALSGPQARALRFLVASAVAGLEPDAVSIIDAQGGLIGSGEEMQQSGSDDRAEILRRNVLRLLEARVGHGNAVVEINVDTVTQREQITERTFDPESRVAISTVTQETNASANDRRNGSVTVAGNLPDGDAGGSGADSSSQDTETREQVNYEVSETQREIVRNPGAVRRLSVAVLVDGIATTGADGATVWAPRPEDEMNALRELVASTVGFDEERGDSITLRSMEFPDVEILGTEAPQPSIVERLGLDMMQVVQLGVLGLVSIVLGLFVVRPILSGGATRTASAKPAGLPAPAPASSPAPPSLPPLSGEIDSGFPQMAMVDDMGGFTSLPMSGMGSQGSGSSGDTGGHEPAERLRRLIEGRKEDAAAILQGWMENGTERA